MSSEIETAGRTPLRDRVAIITGAGSGIGQAFAIAFAKAGARVVVADVADASETISEINRFRGVAIAVRCDVSDEPSVEELIKITISSYGRIDILVNNAGVFPFASIENMTMQLWEQVFAVNVKGAFLCTRGVVPWMKASNSGKIINIGSSTFFMGLAQSTAYVASKGALVGFTRSLARELGSYNIQVNMITPGLTNTRGVANAGITKEFFNDIVRQQCIPRIEDPNDLTGAALFLASSASDFVTGQILNVDGGLSTH